MSGDKEMVHEPSWVPSASPSLAELLARVEAASGPDGGLDVAAIAATNPYKSGPYASWTAAASAFGWDTRVTASIDAALALVERVMPGHHQAIYGVPGVGPWVSTIADIPHGQGANAGWGEAWRAEVQTAPLAILASLLRALIASEGTLDGASPHPTLELKHDRQPDR